jgi:hypothetical protein
MANVTEVILSNIFSNIIQFPEKCVSCTCFKVLPENHTMRKIMHYKYNCFVKEGDNYCDYIKDEIQFLKDIERIESIEGIEERKKYRMEYMKKKL